MTRKQVLTKSQLMEQMGSSSKGARMAKGTLLPYGTSSGAMPPLRSTVMLGGRPKPSLPPEQEIVERGSLNGVKLEGLPPEEMMRLVEPHLKAIKDRYPDAAQSNPFLTDAPDT